MASRDDAAQKKPHSGRAAADAVLAAAVAAGQTGEQAAAAAGVSVSTLTRRMRTPAFRAQVERVRKSFLERASGILAGATTEAAETLRTLLGAGTTPPEKDQEPVPQSVRVAAAKSILEQGAKLRNELDVLARLAAVERALGIAAPSASTPTTDHDEDTDL